MQTALSLQEKTIATITINTITFCDHHHDQHIYPDTIRCTHKKIHCIFAHTRFRTVNLLLNKCMAFILVAKETQIEYFLYLTQSRPPSPPPSLTFAKCHVDTFLHVYACCVCFVFPLWSKHSAKETDINTNTNKRSLTYHINLQLVGFLAF